MARTYRRNTYLQCKILEKFANRQKNNDNNNVNNCFSVHVCEKKVPLFSKRNYWKRYRNYAKSYFFQHSCYPSICRVRNMWISSDIQGECDIRMKQSLRHKNAYIFKRDWVRERYQKSKIPKRTSFIYRNNQCVYFA